MTKSSQKKLSCPLCGRCIGFDESEEENSETKVLITKPRKKRNTKMYIYATICPKCKKELFVSTESPAHSAQIHYQRTKSSDTFIYEVRSREPRVPDIQKKREFLTQVFLCPKFAQVEKSAWAFFVSKKVQKKFKKFVIYFQTCPNGGQVCLLNCKCQNKKRR